MNSEQFGYPDLLGYFSHFETRATEESVNFFIKGKNRPPSTEERELASEIVLSAISFLSGNTDQNLFALGNAAMQALEMGHLSLIYTDDLVGEVMSLGAISDRRQFLYRDDSPLFMAIKSEGSQAATALLVPRKYIAILLKNPVEGVEQLIYPLSQVRDVVNSRSIRDSEITHQSGLEFRQGVAEENKKRGSAYVAYFLCQAAQVLGRKLTQRQIELVRPFLQDGNFNFPENALYTGEFDESL